MKFRHLSSILKKTLQREFENFVKKNQCFANYALQQHWFKNFWEAFKSLEKKG